MTAGLIKLCGLFRTRDALSANEAAPDYAGLVFQQTSPRDISIEKAQQIRRLLLPDIQTVGVFVDAPLTKVTALYHLGLFQVIQLHGNEDKAYLQALRKEVPEAEIWQAFPIKGPETLLQASASQADRVLLDSGQGSGKAFDWSLLAAFQRPFILAGGLQPNNLEQAILQVKPLGVDLSSGIETSGLKDPEKMILATTLARKAFLTLSASQPERSCTDPMVL